MKKLLVLAAMVLATNSFAGQLTDYNQVKSAVTNGESIRIATDFNKCTGKDSKSPRFTLGVFSPNAVIINADGAIKTSLKHFTLNDRNVPGKPVYQYVVYTINPDNSMRLSVYVLDAVKYEMFAADSYTCTIADGVKIYTS